MISEKILVAVDNTEQNKNAFRWICKTAKRTKSMLVATYVNVVPYSEPLNAEIPEIEKAIKSAGLFRIKAARIKNVLSYIFNEIGSLNIEFLADLSMKDAKKWLTDIDGIGPKTAAIVLCFSFGMPAIPVDTHVYRLSKRLGLIGSKITADAAHDLLERIVDQNMIFQFHVYLINHGRNICKAVRPRCKNCVLSEKCPSRVF